MTHAIVDYYKYVCDIRSYEFDSFAVLAATADLFAASASDPHCVSSELLVGLTYADFTPVVEAK